MRPLHVLAVFDVATGQLLGIAESATGAGTAAIRHAGRLELPGGAALDVEGLAAALEAAPKVLLSSEGTRDVAVRIEWRLLMQ